MWIGLLYKRWKFTVQDRKPKQFSYLKYGKYINESKTTPKIEDRKELVLHVEDVKEKKVNTKDSKDISKLVAYQQAKIKVPRL